ncbi:MAG TPA: SRPBCC domain-containing protein [Candidatus Dormibacteraeota bacterium]|nr:SRPBCC domain-containing protein [Candidatus Dormibacteraeota bacterium]
MNLDVSHQELIPHPVDKVWAALTDPASISDWLMATDDFRPKVGCRFRMKTQRLSTTGWVDAEVLELEPPHRMVWSWSANDGNPPSTVTFHLVAEEDGTRLSLRQVGEIDPAMGAILREGWPGRLQALAELIGQRRKPEVR